MIERLPVTKSLGLEFKMSKDRDVVYRVAGLTLLVRLPDTLRDTAQ